MTTYVRCNLCRQENANDWICSPTVLAACRMLQAATRHDAMPQILFLNSTVTSATYRA